MSRRARWIAATVALAIGIAVGLVAQTSPDTAPAFPVAVGNLVGGVREEPFEDENRGEEEGREEDEESEGSEGSEDHERLEAIEATNGEESIRFRHLQQSDENGAIPTNALLRAVAHVDEMRSFARTAPDAGAGISRDSWEWLGPGNIGGRIRAILVSSSDSGTIWIGSATGGIFKTTNGGVTWAHLDDFLSNLAVSSLVSHPSTPNTIYAATGENTTGNRNGGGPEYGNRGAGVFKSVDGGTTWSQLSSTTGNQWWYTNRLAVSPSSPNTLLAATWGGIYRTVDGGVTWTNEYQDPNYAIQDIDFDPSDGTKAIAGGWGGQAYYSTNGGDSWQLATGIPTASRVEVTYAASNPSITYASVNLNGGAIYRSVDGGQTYSFAGPTPTDVDYLGGQGGYDNAIWVSPTNPDRLIVGGIDLYQSTDAGATLIKISDWGVNQNYVRSGNPPDSAHADHHAIVQNANYPNDLTVYFGNDGGLFKTTDVTTVTPTSGWQELNNNLGITQFYGAGGSVASGKIVGGTQDNGTLRFNGATETWNMTFGGDGGFSAADPMNASYMYGEYVYGAAFRSSDGGANGDYISGLTGYNGDGSFQCAKAAQYEIADMCNKSANFIAPLVLDSSNAQRLLVGGISLWRTNDARTPNTATTGPTWTSIKPAGVNNSQISAIAIDRSNSDLVYVGHNNGVIYRSTNATAASPTWTRVDLASMPSRIVLGLTIDPSDSDVVYALFGGFNSDNVWRLSDGNLAWTERTGSGATGLPDVPARTLAVNAANPSWIYLGTEIGVFTSEDAGATWTIPSDGPANVPVDELFTMGNDLVAATYGRGVWRASLTATSAPGAPTDVSASAGDAQATVSWTPPASDGGSPITNYIVTPYIGATGQTPTQVGNVTSTPITGLTNGQTYTFKVGAKNAIGTGPQSAASNAVTPQPAGNTCNGEAGTVVGTSGSDDLTGTAGVDVIVGLGGDDTIRGLGGNDVICAGDGDDVVLPGVGDEAGVDGGAGSDTISYADTGSGASINLTNGDMFHPGGDGEYDTFTGFENAVGGDFDDTLIGSAGANRLEGGGGSDSFSGQGGDDTLLARDGQGGETVNCGDGADTALVDTGDVANADCETVSQGAAAVADFDGDGDTDIALFRPSNGRWYIRGQSSVDYGLTGDIPVPGDYDADGTTDIAVYRPSSHRWYIQGETAVGYGVTGDVPVPGDYDGDGATDIAVYRPSNGRWYIQGDPFVGFGVTGDVPVPGDYDADGATDIAVYRPSNGRWYIQGNPFVGFGLTGDVPVPGDYDADGTTDIAIYRPSNGRWYIQGNPFVGYGLTGDIPVPGDYDADGTTDIAVYRPSSKRWYIQNQPAVGYGNANDIPVALPYAIHNTYFSP